MRNVLSRMFVKAGELELLSLIHVRLKLPEGGRRLLRGHFA